MIWLLVQKLWKGGEGGKWIPPSQAAPTGEGSQRRGESLSRAGILLRQAGREGRREGWGSEGQWGNSHGQRHNTRENSEIRRQVQGHGELENTESEFALTL